MEYIIVFRSRTQVLNFKKMLEGNGVYSQIVATPQRLAIGCGLSLKIASRDFYKAKDLLDVYKPQGFVGIYDWQ